MIKAILTEHEDMTKSLFSFLKKRARILQNKLSDKEESDVKNKIILNIVKDQIAKTYIETLLRLVKLAVI